MHRPIFDQLTSLLTTAMRDALRSRRLDPNRVPFKVHVSERAANGVLFLGVSFPTMSKRAPIRSVFWGAVALLPFGFRHPMTTESATVMALVPDAEHVAVVEVRAMLRGLLGAGVYDALTIEDVHLLLGTYRIVELRDDVLARFWGVRAEGHAWAVDERPAAALLGARFESEAAARKAVTDRCENLLDGNLFAKVG
jgi:hypothetical protein